MGLSNVLFTKKRGLNENDSRGCRIHCIRISSEYENQSLRSSATYGLKRSVLAKTSRLMPTYLIWNENQSYRSSAHARRNKTNTGNRLPIAGLTSHSTHTRGLKKKKGARRDQLNLLPTYLIWYEDQGDVVPLRRDTGLA